MRHLLTRLWKDEDGQDTAEFALLMALVAVASIAVEEDLAGAINGLFNFATGQVTTATT
jgi:Flp pilus assembly pilin Flp